MKVGFSSFACTWAIGVPGYPPARPLGLLDLLEMARKYKIRVVQVCDNLPLHEQPSDLLAAFQLEAVRSGIALEVGTRGLEPDLLMQYLHLARTLGSPFLRVMIDRRGDQPSSEAAVARLKPMMSEFRKAGVKLAIENHDRFPARTLANMIEALDPDWAGICLDTVNALGALEGPETVVDVLAPYTLNVHVKDFIIRRADSQMGFVVEGCPAGQGRLNVPWLVERMRQAQKDVNFILELWVPPADLLEDTLRRERSWIEESLEYLRDVVGA